VGEGDPVSVRVWLAEAVLDSAACLRLRGGSRERRGLRGEGDPVPVPSLASAMLWQCETAVCVGEGETVGLGVLVAEGVSVAVEERVIDCVCVAEQDTGRALAAGRQGMGLRRVPVGDVDPALGSRPRAAKGRSADEA